MNKKEEDPNSWKSFFAVLAALVTFNAVLLCLAYFIAIYGGNGGVLHVG